MTRLSELIVRIVGDPSKFQASMAQVNRDLVVTSDKIGRSQAGFQKFASSMRDAGSALAVGVSLPLAGFAAMAVKSAADLEALKLGLTAVTGSAAEANRQFTALREVAKLPGLGLEEAARGATNLQALGFSFSNTERILLGFGNALASVGRGREDLEEVIRQLGQMASRGKVTADNLKPILERVPQVAGIIRQEFGTIDTEVLQQMGVSAERMTEVLIQGLEKLPRVAGGLKNDFENLKDSITLALAGAGEALAPFAKRLIDELVVPSVNGITEAAQSFKKLSAESQGLVVGFGSLVVGAPLLVAALGTIVEKALVLRGALGLVTASFGGPLGLTAVAAASIGAVLIGFRNLDAQLEETERKFEAWQKKAKPDDTPWRDTNLSLTELQMRATAAGDAHKKLYADVASGLGITVQIVGEQKKAAAGIREGGEEAEKTQPKFRKLVNENRVLAEMFRILSARANETAASIAKARLSVLAGGRPQMEAPDIQIPAGDVREIQIPVVLGVPDTSGLDEIRRAYETLGIDHAKLGRSVGDLEAAYDTLKRSGVASNAELVAAEVELLTAKKRNNTASAEEIAQLERLTRTAQKAKTQLTILQEAGRRLREIFQNTSKEITNLLFEGGKLGDRMKKMGEEIVKSFAQMGLERTFSYIGKQIQGLLKDLPVVGDLMRKVFGVGASAATSAAGGVASAAGGVAGAAGSVAGAAGGTAGQVAGAAAGAGIQATVGMVAGIASAVSGVIGNFQMAGMNKSLDLIEHETRYSQIHLLNILEKLNAYLPWTEIIHDRLAQFATLGMPVYSAAGDQGLRFAGAGGGGTTINVSGASFIGFRDLDAFLDEIARRLKQRGV